MNKQTHRHTNKWTYRKHQPRVPMLWEKKNTLCFLTFYLFTYFQFISHDAWFSIWSFCGPGLRNWFIEYVCRTLLMSVDVKFAMPKVSLKWSLGQISLELSRSFFSFSVVSAPLSAHIKSSSIPCVGDFYSVMSNTL